MVKGSTETTLLLMESPFNSRSFGEFMSLKRRRSICGSALGLLALTAHPAWAGESSVRLLEMRSYAGVHTADYSTIGGGNDSFVAARTSLGFSVYDPLKFRLDGLFGRFGSGTLVGTGALRLYGQTERFAWGTGYQHVRLDSEIYSHVAMLHAEVYEGRMLTVVSSGGYEVKNFGDDIGFAELFLRLYPLPWLTTTVGASYAVSSLKQTRADIILRVEARVLALPNFQVNVFAQYGGNQFTRVQAGLSVYFDNLLHVERERRDGLFFARFD
jgi:hypothetical protein